MKVVGVFVRFRAPLHGPSFRKWGEKATTEMGEDIDPGECHQYNKGIRRNTRRDAQHVHKGQSNRLASKCTRCKEK
jgi:hypothetical protein